MAAGGSPPADAPSARVTGVIRPHGRLPSPVVSTIRDSSKQGGDGTRGVLTTDLAASDLRDELSLRSDLTRPVDDSDEITVSLEHAVPRRLAGVVSAAIPSLVQGLIRTLEAFERSTVPAVIGDPAPLEIHLLGLVPELGRARQITIGSRKQRMSTRAFARLVRLVVARVETGGEFMDGDELVRVGRKRDIFQPNEFDKAVKSIRDALYPFFGDRVVEVSHRRARLAPDVPVSWDLERLLQDASPDIRALADRLPLDES